MGSVGGPELHVQGNGLTAACDHVEARREIPRRSHCDAVGTLPHGHNNRRLDQSDRFAVEQHETRRAAAYNQRGREVPAVVVPQGAATARRRSDERGYDNPSEASSHRVIR